MTACSGASISRRKPSAPGAAPGPTTRCEWAPQRDGPRGIIGLFIRGLHMPARRGCEPGSHFSQSGVHRGASAAGGFPGPEGLENKTLPSLGIVSQPTRLPAHGCIFLCMLGAASAQGRAQREGAKRWRLFPTPPLFCLFAPAASARGYIRHGAVCSKRETFFSCLVARGHRAKVQCQGAGPFLAQEEMERSIMGQEAFVLHQELPLGLSWEGTQ